MKTHNGNVYTAAFAAVSLTTNAQCMLNVLAPSNSRVAIEEIQLSIASSVALALGVQVQRGSTASSTSAAITARNHSGWSGAKAAEATVNGPSSGLPSTTSAVLMHAEAIDQNVWCYKPCPPLVLDVSQRLQVLLTAPAAALTTSVYGSVTFAEVGKPPVS